MTPEEKITLQQLSKNVVDLQKELFDIQHGKSDVEIIGRAVNDTISIRDLEVTLETLKNLRTLGYKKIDLT